MEGIDLHQFESDSTSTSTTTEVYNSPEYTPYNERIQSEESDEEENQESISESHTNNALVSTEENIIDRAKKSNY